MLPLMQGDEMMFTRVVSGLAVGLALAALGSGASGAVGSHTSGAGGAQPSPADHAGRHAAAEHAEPSGGEHGEIDPLDFKADLAIWTAVVFLVLVAILWKFAWGPLAAGLDKREQGIADQIAQAEQSNQQAKQMLAEYQQKLAGAGDEVRGIIEAGRRDAEQLGREMLQKTKDEAKAEQQHALEQIDAATAGALKDLAEQGATLAVELAGKIVRAELKSDDHAQLIQHAVADFAEQKHARVSGQWSVVSGQS